MSCSNRTDKPPNNSGGSSSALTDVRASGGLCKLVALRDSSSPTSRSGENHKVASDVASVMQTARDPFSKGNYMEGLLGRRGTGEGR